MRGRRFVCVHRRFPGEPRLHGLVLGVSEALVVLAQFHDFYPEGFAVLRLQDVATVRSDEREEFWERVLRSEGVSATIAVHAPPLSDFGALLKHLLGTLVIVERETQSEENDLFEVGRILHVDDAMVRVKYVDTVGRWDEEPDEIQLRSITKVQFETPYLKMFAKYAQHE